MSLETLLEAARYVEQQEKKRERAASTSSSSELSLGAAPYSNHHNSEPRGAKRKRDRADADDLFCEEKMLIIDEEEPSEARTNGSYSTGLRQSPPLSYRETSAASNSSHMTEILDSSHPHPHQRQLYHQNNHEPVLNHYLDSHGGSSNNSPAPGSLVVDIEASGQDGKKPRNGPCVIRSGTREVHNKLEKNRRAHLKECFEMLKKQLPSQDEKKSSNLSILHAAIRHIQMLRRKEREYEHEMERLAREKIAAQQRLAALKKELAATWDHIDFAALLPENNVSLDTVAHAKHVSEGMQVDATSLARSGTRYSSTSSLSSAATANSPPQQNHQITNSVSSVHNQQVASATIVCQTQGLNLASSRSSPPVSVSPATLTSSIPPVMMQEKIVTATPTIVHQQQQQQPQQQLQQQSHQLHLPINAQMLSTSQGLATIVPTLQHIGPGLRVIPGDTRQLLVQSNAGSESRPVTLVVHSSAAANDNRVTFVQTANLSNNERPLALAVQSSASEVRPMTFVHSGNEGRPLVLTTATATGAHHPATLNASNAQARIRTTVEASATHKMVGGVTLVGGNGTELTRLPGGAELNILPANGVFRSVKAQPLTVPGGLTLSHAGVSLQSAVSKSGGSTVVQSAPSTAEGIAAHIVGQHAPLSGLVTPMTVVSQGNQVTAHIIGHSNLAGKVITTPILKTVGQMPLVSAQYLNTLVKPVVVVTSSSNAPTTMATSNAQQQQQHQQQQQQNSSVPHSSV